MSTDNISILPSSQSDLPTFIEFLHASKLELTINRLMYRDWPNNTAQRAQAKRAIEGGYGNGITETFKAVDNVTGSIVGHLFLTRRKPADKEDQKDEEAPRESNYPDGANLDVFPWVVEWIESISEDKDLDHLEITHIFITPTYRRQKVGTQLVRLAIEKAKEAGVPLSFGSEPGAHDFFLSLGFEDKKHADIDLTKFAPKHSGFGVFRLTRMYSPSK